MNINEAINQMYLVEGTDNAKMVKRANNAQTANSAIIQKIQANQGDKRQQQLLVKLNKALDQVQTYAAAAHSLG